MKIEVVLHEADPFAFGGAGDDGRGLSLHPLCLIEGSQNLCQVVPIDLANMPAEGAPLISHGLGIHHLIGPAIDLLSVAINDGNQIIHLIVGGSHRCLPYLPLIALSIAEENVDPIIAAVKTGGEGNANTEGKPLPQSPGRHLHPGGFGHVGVALHPAV